MFTRQRLLAATGGLAVLLAAPAAPALSPVIEPPPPEAPEAPLLMTPAGVIRYAQGTAFEAAWTYGALPYAGNVRGGGLRFRETNGPVVSILLQVAAAIGGSAAASSSAKDDYAAGRATREQAQKRIDDADARAQYMLTHAYDGALFDTDLTLYSDKFAGRASGWDLRVWIGKHDFVLGPTVAEFEWGLKAARVWGPTYARPEQPELFDHAHLGATFALRADVTRYGEVSVRFEPNGLRLLGAPNHESPLFLGAAVSPFEMLLVGGELAFTSPGAPQGAVMTLGVRL